MKNRINFLAFLSILFFTAISCNKELEIDFDAEKQLVVNALINDHEHIALELSESFAPGLNRETELEIIEFPSAKVDVYENNIFKETLNYSKQPEDAIGRFRSSFIPDPLKDYSIKVEESQYGELSAETSIPNGVSPTNGFLEKVEADNGYEIRYFFSFEIQDPPAQDNYYYFNLTHTLRMVDTITGDTLANDNWQYFYLNVNDESNKLLYLNTGYVFSDEQFDGQTYAISGIATVDTPHELTWEDIWFELDTTKAFIHLHELSPEAYNFYSSHAHYLINKEQFYSDPVTHLWKY